VQLEILDPAGNIVGPGYLAGGLTANVNVTSSNTSFGTITTSPVVISAGGSQGQTQFQPLAAGSTTISVSAGSPFTVPTADSSLKVTVGAPAISIDSGNTVGNHLELPGIVSIPPSATEVTVALTATGQMSLSATGTDAGSASINVKIPAGQTTATYYMYGLADSGTATVTATASGYTSGNGTETLAPSAVVIEGPQYPLINSISTTVGGSATVTIATAILNSANNPVQEAVAGTTSLSVTLGNSNPTVGTFPAKVTIGPGASSTTAQFQGAATGTTTLSITEPPGYDASTQYAQLSATVQ
jgi:hypothetical protein